MTRLIRMTTVAGCIMIAAPTLLAQDMRLLMSDLEQGGRQGQGGQRPEKQGNPKQQLPPGPGPNEPLSSSPPIPAPRPLLNPTRCVYRFVRSWTGNSVTFFPQKRST